MRFNELLQTENISMVYARNYVIPPSRRWVVKPHKLVDVGRFDLETGKEQNPALAVEDKREQIKFE